MVCSVGIVKQIQILAYDAYIELTFTCCFLELGNSCIKRIVTLEDGRLHGKDSGLLSWVSPD